MLNTAKIRNDFPILNRLVNGKPLVYLDSAATSQKPIQVIEAISNYYKFHNANVHRGIHTLGDEASQHYLEAKQKIADFIGSQSDELIFTKNTTEAINLVAFGIGEQLKPKDRIVVSEAEHHSNLVPWQELAKRTGAKLELVPVSEEGIIRMDLLEKLLDTNVKVISLNHVSNFFGSINPISQITRLAKKICPHVLIVLDAAQSAPHLKVKVSDLGVDFLAFSAHKMLGPMGVGVLWGKREQLEKMPPFLTGGGMIDKVAFKNSTWADLPDKFEAGTSNVAGVIGLGAAIDYLNQVGLSNIEEHEQDLTKYLLLKLKEIEGMRIYGPKEINERAGVVTFTLDKIHAHDVAQILDREAGVAVRSGHHCVMPMHTKLGLPATTRASFYLYNTHQEIDTLIEGIKKVKEIFQDG